MKNFVKYFPQNNYRNVFNKIIRPNYINNVKRRYSRFNWVLLRGWFLFWNVVFFVWFLKRLYKKKKKTIIIIFLLIFYLFRKLKLKKKKKYVKTHTKSKKYMKK